MRLLCRTLYPTSLSGLFFDALSFFDAFDVDYSTVDYDFDAIEKRGLRNDK